MDENVRQRTSFDANWMFIKGDTADAQDVDFDDAGWRRLNLPHDWSIEGPFSEDQSRGRGGAHLPAGIGVDNGNPSSHEPFQADRRKTFNGLCLAIVESTATPGEIRVTASAPGLDPGQASVQTCQVGSPPSVQ